MEISLGMSAVPNAPWVMTPPVASNGVAIASNSRTVKQSNSRTVAEEVVLCLLQSDCSSSLYPIGSPSMLAFVQRQLT